MLDLGWMEVFFVAVLALVIIGPKDLPGFVRNLGRLCPRAPACRLRA